MIEKKMRRRPLLAGPWIVSSIAMNLMAIAFGFQANADQQTNPYSPDRYATYPQYQQGYTASASNPTERKGCKDPNWDGDCVCEQQKQKIAWVKSEGKALNVFNWSNIRSKQLVMIGDAHGISNPDSILDLMRLARSESGKQCVFFEISSDWSGDEFLKLLREKTGDPEADRLRRYYDKLANGAIAQGFTPYMVDDPRNWSGDRIATDFEREIHMATIVEKLFVTQKCEHAIFMVGKAHITGKNLPALLTQAGISLTRLNPIHAPNEGRSGPTEEWNGLCTSQTYTPSEALIFGNSGIKDHWVTPGFTPPLTDMTFGSFDYSILFPEAHFEQKSSFPTNGRPAKSAGAVR